MNNITKTFIIAAATLIPTVGIVTLANAQENTSDTQIASHVGGPRGNKPVPQEVLDFLGVTEAEAQAAKDSGEVDRREDFFAYFGKTLEEFETYLDENGIELPNKGLRDEKRQEKLAELSEVLGLTEDQLKEAKQAGTSIEDLFTQQGVDFEAFKAEKKAEKIAEIQAKIDSGEIDAEKGAEIIEKINSGEKPEGRRGGF